MWGPRHSATRKAALVIDKTVTLDINGSNQYIRLCAERTGLPPLLIVQAGPGLPVLHEVVKFQRRLYLEDSFLVCYWEQRGCGRASGHDANSVSLQQQVEDLCTVLQWLHQETQHTVIVFGISLGATIALQAAEQASDHAEAVIAISPDADTAGSDAAVYAFLQEQSARSDRGRLRGRLKKLGAPPYADSAAFQRRAMLLADLGTIEHGKTFATVLRETLLGMVGTYGPVGTVQALRNMNLIQRRLLLPLVSLDLLAKPPRIVIPVHYVFAEQDALTPVTIVERLPVAISAPESTVIRVPEAGHMVHFDQPEVVRAVALRARRDA
jgi:proline iminopeptidase